MLTESEIVLVKKNAELCGVGNRIAKIESARKECNVNIGFIGPFSAGKTSLINALLGTKLPVDIEPTTKSICIIEADAQLAEKQYFRDVGVQREPIDFIEFSDILCGKAEGDGVLRMPPCEFLQPGVTIVDTPGVDSMGTEEKARTCSYLSLMDAAVVCLPVSDGSMKKSVIDFIMAKELRHFTSNLVFAITMCDTKAPSAVDSVRAKVVSDLEELVRTGALTIDDVAGRVFVVSRKNAKEVLTKYVAEKILPAKERMANDRFETEIRKLSGEVSTMIRDRAEAMRFDDSQYEAERLKIESERNGVARLRERKQRGFEDAEAKLRSEVCNVVMMHKLQVTSATDSESQGAAVRQMMGELDKSVNAFCQRYVDGFKADLNSSVFAQNRFIESIRTIDNVRDMSVMALTAAATAWFAPGASAAANAAEATAGAAAQGAAKEAAKSAVKAAAAGAGKKAAGSFLSKVVGCIGTVIKDINPLEYIGDLVASRLKGSSFDDMARSISASVAAHVMENLSEAFEKDVIGAYADRLNAYDKALAEVQAKRMSGLENYHQEYDRLLADAAELNKLKGDM